MSSKLFVLFGKHNSALFPNIYKRHAKVLELVKQNNQYDFRQFLSQTEAEEFCQTKLAEANQVKNALQWQELKEKFELDRDEEYLKDQKLTQPIDNEEKIRRLEWFKKFLYGHHIRLQSEFQASQAQLDPSICYTGYFHARPVNPEVAQFYGGYWLSYTSAYPISLKIRPLLIRPLRIGFRSFNGSRLVTDLLLMGDCYCNGVKKLKILASDNLSTMYMKIDTPSWKIYRQAIRIMMTRFAQISFETIPAKDNLLAQLLAEETHYRHWSINKINPPYENQMKRLLISKLLLKMEGINK